MTKNNKKLLIVEDDLGLQSQLKWSFEDLEVATASNATEAITELRRFEPQVVTLDLGLPPDPGGVSEGFALLSEIIQLSPSTKVIVVTGHNDRNNAVKAIASGAYDFFEKPIEPDLLQHTVNRAIRLVQLETENRQLNEQNESPLSGVIACSNEMLKVCRSVERLANIDVSTLILGESGTGKEVIVKALHKLSSRSKKRLVAINCAAIPENLLESELFGYEKGAFTGATKSTKGKFEAAEGGILFLDEIGDMPLSLQAKLLRFLQERVIERLGSHKEIAVDVRIICATHQDLKKQIEEGIFREDLYYRINEVSIHLPPLREREGDILLLSKHFMEHYSKELKIKIKGFTPKATSAMVNYHWPGNIRELENKVKRAVIMADSQYITIDDLELESVKLKEMSNHFFNLREARESAEKKAINQSLAMSKGNMTKAAQLLGVTRPTLYSIMEKYQMREEV